MVGKETINISRPAKFHDVYCRIFSVIPTELKMTEWKTTVHVSASSQSSIDAQQKVVLARVGHPFFSK